MDRIPVLVSFLVLNIPNLSSAGTIEQLGHQLQKIDRGQVSSNAVSAAIVSNMQSEGALPDTAVIHSRLMAMAPDNQLHTRGAKEARIYSKYSPSVVLIITNEALGSGSILSRTGEILTNWHVVDGYDYVAVIFKPKTEGGKIEDRDVYRARVVRIDEVADLALLQVDAPPPNITPIQLGTASEVEVGLDVHAIGHPTGEAWSYTKGIISQVRKDYEWVTQANREHVADVIQTQTPINPGNSGGPLLSDEGHLIGVNSFKAQGEALNFAVSLGTIKLFLASHESRYAIPATRKEAIRSKLCQPTKVGESRNAANSGTLTLIDLDCDGLADGELNVPDSNSVPLTLSIDSTGDGKVDTIVSDTDRDGGWDVSIYDVDGDSKPDLVGFHPDGKLQASRFEPYSREGS